jgi:hypothetical protein
MTTEAEQKHTPGAWDFREVPAGSVLDEFHHDMWAGLIHFLLTNEEALQAFKEETGHIFITKPRNGIEAMIDNACGFDPAAINDAAMRAFIPWATENYWGDETQNSPAIIAALARTCAQ